MNLLANNFLIICFVAIRALADASIVEQYQGRLALEASGCIGRRAFFAPWVTTDALLVVCGVTWRARRATFGTEKEAGNATLASSQGGHAGCTRGLALLALEVN